ncbi:hypothetical protein ElyMa_000558500 [Elysia marginata]|uniref:Uncharacterized protein n=1 Tax=Elysia marginata TaxID=1093978 RepID=A0AAV4G208_9GAST|nr:hypothetical protein ElyMa_000558500 [Elysia marginata]
MEFMIHGDEHDYAEGSGGGDVCFYVKGRSGDDDYIKGSDDDDGGGRDDNDDGDDDVCFYVKVGGPQTRPGSSPGSFSSIMRGIMRSIIELIERARQGGQHVQLWQVEKRRTSTSTQALDGACFILYVDSGQVNDETS